MVRITEIMVSVKSKIITFAQLVVYIQKKKKINTLLELYPFAFILFEVCIHFFSVLDTLFYLDGPR